MQSATQTFAKPPPLAAKQLAIHAERNRKPHSAVCTACDPNINIRGIAKALAFLNASLGVASLIPRGKKEKSAFGAVAPSGASIGCDKTASVC